MNFYRRLGNAQFQRNHLAVAFIVALSVVLAVFRIDAFQIGSWYDDAWYINAATSLAKGKGYVRLWTPNNVAETFLPPGYPLLLTPLRWLFPGSILPLQLISLAATLGTILLSWWYYGQRLKGTWKWLALLLLAVNVSVVGFSIAVMTEAPYTFLSMLTISATFYLQKHSRRSIGMYLLVGLIAAAASFVRTIGITLVGSLILYYLLNKEIRRATASAVPYFLLAIVWLLRNNSFGVDGITYGYGVEASNMVSFLSELNQQLFAKISVQWLQNLPNLLAPGLFGPRVIAWAEQLGLAFVLLGVGALVFVILTLGYVQQFRRGYTVAELYAPLYIVALSLVWPLERYWVPLVPLLILYFATAFQVGPSQIGQLVGRPKFTYLVAVGALVLLILLHLGRNVQATINPVKNRIPDVAVAPLWIARNTDQSAVIMATTPRVSYLYSGHVTVPFPGVEGEVYDLYPNLAATEPTEQLYEAIQEFGVDYVIVEPKLKSGHPFTWPATVEKIMVPVLEEDSERFRQVLSDASTQIRIYEVQSVEDS